MVQLVPIDLSTDALLGRTSTEIARLNGGKPPSPTAWWSWMKHGRAGLRLPSVVVGGKRMTTLSAFTSWIHATTAAIDGAEAAGLVRTAASTAAAKRRESEIDEAIERIKSRTSPSGKGVMRNFR